MKFKHLKWVNLYENVGNAGIVYQRCGISRPTLREGLKRYEQFGLEGLKGRSRRLKASPQRTIDDEKEDWILKLRSKNNVGHTERQYHFQVSLAILT